MTLRTVAAPRSSETTAFLEWLAALGSSVVFRVPGRDRSRCRVVCTLLHGNETSGARALQRFLAEAITPEVDLVCILGSVPTALLAPVLTHRQRPGGRDLNRCFGPALQGQEPARPDEEADQDVALARAIFGAIEQLRPEAAVDLHNTSGKSPAYAIASYFDAERAALTRYFAERLIITDLRLNTFTEAVDPLCPVVTVECGGAHDPESHETAYAGLVRYARGEALRVQRVQLERSAPLTVLEHPLRVELVQGASLSLGAAPNPNADLTLRTDIERYNYEHLPEGTALGWLGPRGLPVLTCRRREQDIAHAIFADQHGELVTRRPLDLLMVTTRLDLAQSDCLFYAVLDCRKH